MALRFSCKGVAITTAGTTFAHGLTIPNGTATAPDEWAIVARGPVGAASGLATGFNATYVSAAPNTTQLAIASMSGTATADVFAWINHSSVG